MRELMSYLPENYPASKETVTFQEALQPEVGVMWQARDDLLAQLDPYSATWGLDYWEDALGLSNGLGLDLDTRRRVIVAKLQGRTTTTPEVVKNVAETLLGVPVEVIEIFDEYTVLLATPAGFLPKPRAVQLRAQLRDIMPAHLDFQIIIPTACHLSITGLLGGERRKAREFSTSEEEWIVEGAVVALTSQEEARQRQNRRRWGGLYAAALACAVLETLLFGRRLLDPAAALMILPPMLAAIFGLHFCCFAKEKLPAFYDQYKVNFYSSGMMRMDVGGVYFNNSNWPHILRGLRVWSVAAAVGMPLLDLVMGWTWPAAWDAAGRWVLLALFLGGLFVPVYVAARRYE